MKRKVYANLDELVFEDRNRFYGAYVLRKQYEDNLLMGLLFGLLVVGAVVSIPYLQNLFRAEAEPLISVPYDPTTLEAVPEDVPDIVPPTEKPVEPAQPDAASRTFTQFRIAETNTNVTINDELENMMPSTENNDGPMNLTYTPPTTNNDKIIGEKQGGNNIYDFVKIEVKPQYPGGEQAMYDFLGGNLQFPETAKRLGIEGTVTVAFVIDEFGAVRDVKVERGIGGGCDEEAVRVIKSMKRWKPGRQGGHAVRVRYSIPIQFNFN